MKYYVRLGHQALELEEKRDEALVALRNR